MGRARSFRSHEQVKACPECRKSEWIWDRGSKNGGANIQDPEALDKAANAFSILHKAQPAKSTEKSGTLQSHLDTHLADFADAKPNRPVACQTAQRTVEGS